MRTSDRGIELVKEFEKFSRKLYNCQANHCTIGYGHKLHDGPCCGAPSEAPYVNGITHERALELLRGDVKEAEDAVNKMVKVIISQNEFDALVCLVFNIGVGAFYGSTLLKELNNGNFHRIPDLLDDWHHIKGKDSNGLIARRLKEVTLWGEGSSTTVVSES